MHLGDFIDPARWCRDHGFGFEEFCRLRKVMDLRWPRDVLKQWVYDHADNPSFLIDYEKLELTQIAWKVEPLMLATFMTMPTGPSDRRALEDFAADPDHWVSVRHSGEHLGVREAWETHGTWKRWPIVLDRKLLVPYADGFQLVEGRTRVGVLRGRCRQGQPVAERHLAWVGRSRDR